MKGLPHARNYSKQKSIKAFIHEVKKKKKKKKTCVKNHRYEVISEGKGNPLLRPILILPPFRQLLDSLFWKD